MHTGGEMMLKIILCDNDPFILKLSLDKISIILRSNHLDAEVVCTAAGSEKL